MALLLSTKFIVINVTMAEHGVTRMRPRAQKAVDLRPTPTTAKNLQPRAGSATEVP